MKIHSYNEWDKLRSVVVGTASYANWPSSDPVFSKESQKTTWKETPPPSGAVPQHIVNETNEDLEELVNTLVDYGAKVHRPEELNFVAHEGMYNYCPRDRLLVYGDTIVNPAMMYPCRDMELQCLYDIVDSAKDYLYMPRFEGMVLDAANICRLNNKILFLESESGNRKAYEWIKTVLGQMYPELEFELCNFYAGVHIDSTVVPLREGLVMLNASRVNEENCPAMFKTWDKIYVEDVVAQDFYQYPYASKWIAMNMLVLDPHTVICDRHQTELIRKLEQWSFTVIPLELRHSRTLGGGFHCVTLDLHREP
jgi:N-dimethylarginine dimethylaminohydrolase